MLSNRDSYKELKVEARKTIINNYDLEKICLPKQINLIKVYYETSRKYF